MTPRSAARAMAVLTSALLLSAAAQAQVTLGRLFATPAERAAMEASRGASAALAPNSQGEQPAAGTPGGPAPISPPMGPPVGPPMSASQMMSPPVSASQPSGAPMPAPPMGAMPTGAPPLPGGADPAASTGGVLPAAAPPALTMSGVLRRNGDRNSTIWLNNQPQYSAQKNLTVTLLSGKKVTLKPGQRYDLNEGRVKDVNEP